MNGIEAKKKQKNYEAVIVLLNAAYKVMDENQIKTKTDFDYMYRINELMMDLNNDAYGLSEIYLSND